MKVIGFSTEYYTLWEMGEPYEVAVYYGTLKVGSHIKVDVFYIQNLSKDLEEAKKKLEGSPYKIDLELRGHSSFNMLVSSDVKDREEFIPQDCFSFGRYEGVAIHTVTDLFQLFRALEEEKSPRRRVHARSRLVQLGALQRYPHIREGKKKSYASPKFVAQAEEDKLSGHYFTDGEVVELKVKEIRRFGFETTYGYTSVRIYMTSCGKIVKYLGSSPIRLDHSTLLEDFIRLSDQGEDMISYLRTEYPDDLKGMEKKKKEWEENKSIVEYLKAHADDPFIPVKASIKHSEYRGLKETHLQRMKYNMAAAPKKVSTRKVKAAL